MDLKHCPFCNEAPILEDHRLIWAVRCTCGCSVLGERAPEPEKDLDVAYWAYYQQTAIDAWNKRAITAGELHWKNNHDCQVAKARVLIERLDMPVERVKAYEYITEMEDRIDRLEATIFELRNSK